MHQDVLGRTNHVFPRRWLRLAIPSLSEDIDPLVEAALASGVPLDLTPSPALWGGKMRGTDHLLCCSSTLAYENATDATHAADLIQAHLIEILSCIGRENFDFYFLRLRPNAPTEALAGVLDALEWARHEQHIRFLGLACEGPALPVLSRWQAHDAFDVVVADTAAIPLLAGKARERRVGVIEYGTADQTPLAESDVLLATVRHASEVQL